MKGAMFLKKLFQGTFSLKYVPKKSPTFRVMISLARPMAATGEPVRQHPWDVTDPSSARLPVATRGEVLPSLDVLLSCIKAI